MTHRRQPPIAIVGIGGLFPGSVDVAAFWNHILRKSDLITDVPERTHWRAADYLDKDPKAPDKTYCARGGFLPEVPFDSLSVGLPPSLLSSTDTSQLLGLLVARTTLDEAFARVGGVAKADRSKVACILGVTSGQELFGQMAARLAHPTWRAGMKAAGIDDDAVDRAVKLIGDAMVPWTEATFPGLLGNVVAGRIANRLDLGGTNAVTDAACASSFAALSMAIDELVLGRADVVLTGGVDTLNDIFMYMCFSKTPALSATGDCRPFDAKADGTLLGEGLGMLALKRLDDAEYCGDAIWAVIRGVGTSSDGRAKSVYAPVPEGQARATKRAYDAAGYPTSTVELVEAHGTGTRAGDAAELAGLRIAFDGTETQSVAVGSVKSQIGHTKSAAGAAGLLKVALALHHKVIPPTIKVTEPNPAAEIETSPFYIAAEARPWVRPSTHPRRAGVSSFGFGGSNFHITLEEYVPPEGGKARPPRLSRRDIEVIALGADDDAALRALAKSLASQSLQQLAAVTREFRADSAQRACFVASTTDEAKRFLDVIATGASAPGVFRGAGAAPGKVAFLFPGQASQHVGMAAELAMELDAARAALDRADGAVEGLRPSRLMFPAPAFDDATRARQLAELTKTENAQPCLGAASLAYLRALESLGVTFDVAAGHSFGELVALCAAGAFDADALMRLARKRGELMAQASASTPGAMAAVMGKLDPTLLSGLDVVVANENAPDQTVIAGSVAGVDEAVKKLAAAGLSAKKLAVSTAFHSPLVEGAVAPLREFLASMTVEASRKPVYANGSAAAHGADADGIRDALARQVRERVRFVDEIRAMYADGARVFVEVGPGAVLTGLVQRIVPDAVTVASGGKDGLRSFFTCLARLSAAGVAVDYSRLPVSAPSKAMAPTKTSVMINGSNVGKPALPPPAPAAARAPTAAPAVVPARAPAPSPAATAPTQSRAPAAAAPPQSPQTVEPAKRPATRHDDKPSVPAARPGVSMTTTKPAPVNASWIDVLREGQRQTADAHIAFQRAMTDAHTAYLQAFESTQNALVAALTGTAPVVVERRAPALEAKRDVVDVIATNGHANGHSNGHANGSGNGHGHHANGNGNGNGHAKPVVLPAPAIVAPVVAKTQPMPTPVARPPVIAPAPAAPAAPAAAPVTSKSVDARALLVAVVADKTGYPADSLDDSMSLEADLGIDSIKRVEILGALKEKLPAAGTLDALQLAQLKTLGEIARALAGTAAAPTATAAAAPVSASNESLLPVLLDVVAEKTGYPKDALTPSMALESDLGVDSIKRVEILSALKEKVPTLPPVDAVKLAQLQTIGDIAGALESNFGGGRGPF